jgi:hypothetical protein
MPFINGRFYANPIYGSAVELARLIGGQDQEDSRGPSDASEDLQTNVTGTLKSLGLYSSPRADDTDSSDSPSGFCDLTASFEPDGGVNCEPGKDYHGTAYMSLAGPGIQFHRVDEESIRATATADGDIVSVDGEASLGYDGHRQWQVPFTIKAGKGFKQQGGAIVWTVTYKCNGDDLEWQPHQMLYCL